MKKAIGYIYFALPHFLYLAVAISAVLLSDFPSDTFGICVFIAVISAIEALAVVKRKNKAAAGIISITFAILLLWTLYPVFNNFKESFLFPPPQKVAAVSVSDILVLIKSIFASLALLIISFLIAIVLGVVFGLICGRYKRLQDVVMPIARVILPIPALIYAPYVVALMPNFWSAAIFIITSGLFWPILMNVIITLQRFDHDLHDAAAVLSLDSLNMLLHIYLPYCLPSLFNTLSMQVSNAFLLLIGAELMGMDIGLGWYVKYNSDFSDYTRVIAGFIVIGIIVSVVNKGLEKLKNHVLVWKQGNA